MIKQAALQPSEYIISMLRSLYDSFGYRHYKMNKFEEYDLYSKNKDFIIGDSIITFTDTNGKLMALKPDVTLSIVKNTRDVPGSVQKLYYNENVYRVSKNSHTYKEIMQVGLECIGDIDSYCIYEVLRLALRSMQYIPENSILAVSDIGILSQVIDAIGIPADEKSSIFRMIGEKNLHELAQKCADIGIDPEKFAVLRELAALRGSAKDVLPKMEKLLEGYVDKESFERFASKMYALSADESGKQVSIDFSIVDDIHYYNGIVFKGFVEGIPSSVLSGGQYDKLMKKMKRTSGAIGFAVYLDMLEQYSYTPVEYDTDIVLLYDNTSTLDAIGNAAEWLSEGGSRVLACKNKPDGIRYRKLVRIKDSEVEEIEEDA